MKKIFLIMLSICLLLGLGWASALPVSAATSSSPQMQTLYAGQYCDVGTVNVWEDGEDLYVQFMMSGECEIYETHLAVATDPDDIPQTKKGNPIPGQFMYKDRHCPSVSDYTYVVPLPEGWSESFSTLYIAAHAAICCGESAWAGGIPFDGTNWATYFSYNRDLDIYEACDLIMANGSNPDFVILDVRRQSEFDAGHMDGAINIDYLAQPRPDTFTAAVDLLDKDNIYLVYCKTGGRSWNATKIMRNLGFETVFNMLGGYDTWSTAIDLSCTAE